MKKISLKLKITLWYTFILVIISFFIFYAMIKLSNNILIRDMEQNIITSVNDLSYKIKETNNQRITIPEYYLYNNGVQMAIYKENENIVLGRTPFGIQEKVEFKENTLRIKKYNDKEYYFYDRKVDLSFFNEYWVRGVICLSDETQVIQSTVKYNMLLVILFVLLAGTGGYLIISKAFIPVNKIQVTAKEISESSDLSQRINLGNGKDEIYALASTFDNMLEKIESSFNKEKQFTSDASHELRTPISVILAECECAEDCASSEEEYKEVINNIKNQANKMAKLVAELLTVSRIDNNKIKLNFEETDISELLTFVCEEQEEIQTKNIILKQDIQPNLYCEVDRMLITRLFVNLISNAYQYSNENTTITVSLKEKDKEVVFSVQDEGIGISKENIPKIWDRFYQVDSSRTKNENNSSGLGLSMVKWISDKHNGRLSVNSELGKGSTFSFAIKKNIKKI